MTLSFPPYGSYKFQSSRAFLLTTRSLGFESEGFFELAGAHHMAARSWNTYSSSKRLPSSSLQSRFGYPDPYLGFEEGDDSKTDLPCPFCSEDFDVIGLCCHIDAEHPEEADICPICAARVGSDMVGHITIEHGNSFKMQSRRRFRKSPSGTNTSFSPRRKELHDGNIHSFFDEPTFAAATSNTAPDPLLSSFIFNSPLLDSLEDVHTEPLDEVSMVCKKESEKVVESVETSPPEKDGQERARRSEFVQDLVLSTIFDEIL